MKEIWKEIYYYNIPTDEWIDYRGLYQVSNLGRIRSLDRYVRGFNHGVDFMSLIKGKILKTRPNRNGYILAHLGKEGKHRDYSLHRLVYFSFNPDADTSLQVNHIDENISNCALSNLNLMTAKANSSFGTRGKRISNKIKNRPKGPMTEEHKKKISLGNLNSPKHLEAIKKTAIANSKRINQFTKEGVFIASFQSAAEAERSLGIHSQSINACCHLQRPSAGGYVWRFAI